MAKLPLTTTCPFNPSQTQSLPLGSSITAPQICGQTLPILGEALHGFHACTSLNESRGLTALQERYTSIHSKPPVIGSRESLWTPDWSNSWNQHESLVKVMRHKLATVWYSVLTHFEAAKQLWSHLYEKRFPKASPQHSQLGDDESFGPAIFLQQFWSLSSHGPQMGLVSWHHQPCRFTPMRIRRHDMWTVLLLLLSTNWNTGTSNRLLFRLLPPSSCTSNTKEKPQTACD